MNPGSPLKLASVKIREGNRGKHKSIATLEEEAKYEPKPDALTERPEPIAKLTGEARKEWNRLCAELVPTGRLTIGRLSALTELCLLHTYTFKAWQQGMTPNAALLAQKRMMYESFGLTAASIGKTKSLNPHEKAKGIQGYINRKQA